jgi:hypothetical protein
MGRNEDVHSRISYIGLGEKERVRERRKMGGKGRGYSIFVHRKYNPVSNKSYSSSCKSNLGGDQSSCGGLSFETQTGRIDSTRRRSFEAPPVRKPLSVDEAMP